MKDSSHYYSRLDLWDGLAHMEARDEQRARTAALVKESRRRGKRKTDRAAAWITAMWAGAGFAGVVLFYMALAVAFGYRA
jgi:hypothetical protein